MYQETCDNLFTSALAKVKLFRVSPFGYMAASMVAGLFITLGGMVAMAVGGYLEPLMGPASRLFAALVFSSALSLAVMAGCELFTGNNLILSAASLARKLPWRTTFHLWSFCWIGNLIGVWITILLYRGSGAYDVDLVANYFAKTAQAKIALTPLAMVLRGIFCNICVCLAIWCCFRMKSESGKLIMTIWCVFIFMVCGFEHSIANMGIIGVALLNPGTYDVTVAGYITNLAWVTLGNILGATFFVAFPYEVLALPERKQQAQDEPPL